MAPEKTVIAGRNCILYAEKKSEYLLIQPVDDHDIEGLERETAELAAKAEAPFILAAFKVENWNRELSPWDAPPVIGKDSFGHGAEETLTFVEQELIPEVISRCRLHPDIPVILGGYSMAGFFALWSSYRTERFTAVAAASPSVWFPGWIEYVREHRTLAERMYLSLGNKEEKTRNKVMATVGDCIQKQYAFAVNDLGMDHCFFEWNPGNHFREPELRTAKAFIWCIRSLLLSEYLKK